MKKLLWLIPIFSPVLFAGCRYDDGNIWNKINEQDSRLRKLEVHVGTLNNEVAVIRSIVTVLNGDDRVTSVTELDDGYVIGFEEQSAVTVHHNQGAALSVIGVRLLDGAYYWTSAGKMLTDAAGKNLPAGGESAAPEVEIDGNTLKWNISVDGGATWKPTGMNATEGSLFADVAFDGVAVTLKLADGTKLSAAVHRASPRMAFGDLTDDDEYLFAADGNDHTIHYSVTGDVNHIGIVSPNPAPEGWTLNVWSDGIVVSAKGVFTPLRVMLSATTARGAATFYWITLVPQVTSGDDLQTAVDQLENTGGGLLHLPAGEFDAGETLTLTKAVAIRGVSAQETVLNASIESSGPLMLEGLTVRNDKNATGGPVVSVTGDSPLVAVGVVIDQNSTKRDVSAIYSEGDVELTDSRINLNSTGNVKGIEAAGGDVFLDGTAIRTASADEGSNAASSRGIHATAAGQTITLCNGSSMKGFYYPVNLNAAASDTTVNIEDSTLDGYCSVNSWSAGSVITITNSTLTGRNIYSRSGTSNDFAVIVLNKDGQTNAKDQKVTVTDSRLIALMDEGGALEYIFSVRSDGNVISLEGTTAMTASDEIPSYLYDSGTGNTATAGSGVTLNGKPLP